MNKIGVIVGSLRKDSFNRKLAETLIRLATDSLDMEIIEIADLPMYNQDLDDNPPKQWTDFKDQVSKVQGILFVTPEYNRSVPGALKNAIDVGSRPYGKSVWSKKPAAVISGSPGAIGGFGANQHLRQCFVFLDLPCMQQPEAYISDIGNLWNADGTLAKKETEAFLKKYIDQYADWVKTHAG